MTDRELLELAAKAAGVDYIPAEHEKSKEAELRFGLWLKFPDNYEVPDDVRRRWNPLTNDGDALRLVVKLNIDVCFGANYVITRGSVQMPTVNNADDPYAATRRAIVRAAAEIGKAMT